MKPKSSFLLLIFITLVLALYIISNKEEAFQVKKLFVSEKDTYNFKMGQINADGDFVFSDEAPNKSEKTLQNEPLREYEKKLASFKKHSKIKGDFPLDFHYITYDSEDGKTLVMEGFLRSEKAYLGAVATKYIFKAQDVLKTLKQEQDFLPGFEGGFSWVPENTEPTSIEAPQGGFSDSYYWRFKRGDELIYLVYGVREDRLGSHFFIINGPETYIENNEGKFEKFLMSVKPQ